MGGRSSGVLPRASAVASWRCSMASNLCRAGRRRRSRCTGRHRSPRCRLSVPVRPGSGRCTRPAGRPCSRCTVPGRPPRARARILYWSTHGECGDDHRRLVGRQLLAQHALDLCHVEGVDLATRSMPECPAELRDVHLRRRGPARVLPVPGFCWPPVMAVVRLSRMIVERVAAVVGDVEERRDARSGRTCCRR